MLPCDRSRPEIRECVADALETYKPRGGSLPSLCWASPSGPLSSRFAQTPYDDICAHQDQREAAADDPTKAVSIAARVRVVQTWSQRRWRRAGRSWRRRRGRGRGRRGRWRWGWRRRRLSKDDSSGGLLLDREAQRGGGGGGGAKIGGERGLHLISSHGGGHGDIWWR